MVQIKSAVSVLALSASALAATIEVSVTSVFEPNSITAAAGDIIQFNFNGQHSVAQSEFDSPCVATSETAIYSGTLSEGSFSVRVNSSDTLWLYCGFGRHCQGGQTMVVNPPASGDQTLEAYTQAAGNSGNSQNPAGVQGGVLGDASAVPADSGSSTPSGSETTASPSGAASTGTSTSGTASSSAAAATGTNGAQKIGAVGVAGFAGLFAALLA